MRATITLKIFVGTQGGAGKIMLLTLCYNGHAIKYFTDLYLLRINVTHPFGSEDDLIIFICTAGS